MEAWTLFKHGQEFIKGRGEELYLQYQKISRAAYAGSSILQKAGRALPIFSAQQLW
jgi:hypothetical protein